LLAFFPDASLSDGAAEQATNGFFDAFNIPAWDTWVSYFEDHAKPDASYGQYLVAYIPTNLVPVVQAGINVNPEECIVWLSDSQTLLSHALRSQFSKSCSSW
jgi:hypothetical protein